VRVAQVDDACTGFRVGVDRVGAGYLGVELGEVERVLRAEPLELVTVVVVLDLLTDPSPEAEVVEQRCGRVGRHRLVEGALRTVRRVQDRPKHPARLDVEHDVPHRLEVPTLDRLVDDLGLREPAGLVLESVDRAGLSVEGPPGRDVDLGHRERHRDGPRTGLVAIGVPRQGLRVDTARRESIGHEVAEHGCPGIAPDAGAAGLVDDELALG